MRTAPTAPVDPAAAASPLTAADPATGTDATELRPTEEARLDDAAPIAPADTDADETPPAARRPNRHDEQMREIVQRRNEKLAAERAEAAAQGFADQEPLAAIAPAPTAAPVERPAAAPPPEPAAPPSPAGPDAPSAPVAPLRTHKILVRGNEIVMTDDDMRRAAELGVESELRIRQANATLEEARRIAASGHQPIPSAGPSPPAAPLQAQTSEPSGRDRAALLELVREIQYGDEEKAADAFERLTGHQPQAQPADPDAMAREVYARVESRLGLQNALQTFGSEYAEIVNDPDLATLAANYVQQLRGHYAQTGTPRTELDLFREAGNATRQAMQRWSGSAPQPTPDPAPASPTPQPAGGNRLTVKRNMPQAPAAAAQQVTPPPRQKTGSDIVNEMRRARGQPVYA